MLVSPNICKCIEAFDNGTRAFIIIELMDKNITALLTKRVMPFSEGVMKYVLKEALKGLDFLHQRHIIHRDIKSDNILYDSKGNIKLADFGAAVQLTKQTDKRATLMGTDHWIAPEMIFAKKNPASDAKYNTKVDVWSFGIFCIECAMTQPPYYSERKPDKLYDMILKSPAVELGPKWSNELQGFIRRVLNKDPDERPSAAELL